MRRGAGFAARSHAARRRSAPPARVGAVRQRVAPAA